MILSHFHRYSLVIMLVAVIVVLLAGQQALAFNAPRLGGRRQQMEIRKNELNMVQLRLPTGLGLPSPSSWMSGYLRAIETHNDALQISPRRGKECHENGENEVFSGLKKLM
jgi:hypothetical protein